MNPPILLIWEGQQAAYHSIAMCNARLADQMLDDAAVDLRIVSNQRQWPGLEDDPAMQRRHAVDSAVMGLPIREARQRPSLWVRHQWPPRAQAPGDIPWVILQPWEYSLVPRKVVEIFNRTAEVWTMSEFSAKAFRDSGVRVPIRVLPMGVDTELFRPRGAGGGVAGGGVTGGGVPGGGVPDGGVPGDGVPGDGVPDDRADDGDDRFRFLFVGASIGRKGLDLLLTSYARAFGPKDPVSLVVKDVAGGSVYEGQTAGVHLKAFAADPSRPYLEFNDAKLAETELAQLYRRCDVFVASYRGEGFSLPTLEAMASGLPVIVSAGGPTDDFVDETVGWRIPTERRSVGDSIYGQATSGEAFLLEPDVGALEALLREAFENRDEVGRRGASARRRAVESWTWRHSARQVVARAEAVLAEG